MWRDPAVILIDQLKEIYIDGVLDPIDTVNWYPKEQSMEADPEKRRTLVWEIERTLAEDAARPIIFYPRSGTCRYPQVKGLDSDVPKNRAEARQIMEKLGYGPARRLAVTVSARNAPTYRVWLDK